MTSHRFFPGAGFRFLTPSYDRLSRLMGLGDRFRAFEVRAMGPLAGKRLLDVGCGTGELMRALPRDSGLARVVGLDPDPDMIAQADAKLRAAGVAAELARGWAQELPFPDRSFDVVVSSLMFHHLDGATKRAALREWRRVLTPGGRYLLQTPNKWTNIPFEILRHEKKMHLGPIAAYRSATEDHCALHNYWQLRRRLESNGFELTFFDVPVVNDYFKQKVRNYVGPLGPALLTVLNPDKFPLYLRTNFYARAVLRH